MRAKPPQRRAVVGVVRLAHGLGLDLPGCGLSGRPDASYTIDWQARLVAAWLDELGITECDVVGHSYGVGMMIVAKISCHGSLKIRSNSNRNRKYHSGRGSVDCTAGFAWLS